MLRGSLNLDTSQGERYFRWRGAEVSRLEALTDAVFAISLTLIVVSLRVPVTFDELQENFRFIPVFAATFAISAWVWHSHYLFHRRYGLEDGVTLWLNMLLLFVVLLYVYPMRFLFGLLYSGPFLGRGGVVHDAEGQPVTDAAGEPLYALGSHQGTNLMIYYGLGFAAVFLLYTLLYLRAWARRESLQLDATERLVTRYSAIAHGLVVLIALVSVGLSTLGGQWNFWAGMTYFLIGPVQGLWGWWGGRRIAASGRAQGL